MAYKTFSIDDFSGGLNTAVAQSRLDVRFSPDLQNVDFTDTGAITRRKGYTVLTPSAFTAPIKALHRYYQADGGRFWLTVSGTAVYSAEDVASEVMPTTLEAEDATISGSTTTIARASSSGGQYVSIVGASAVFTIPSYCTTIAMYHNCSSTIAASISVDGAAYVSATGPEAIFASLGGTPSSRTVKVKPAPRNSTSGKLDVNLNGGTVGRARIVNPLSLIKSDTVSIRFYDTMFDSFASGRVMFKGNMNADTTDSVGVRLYAYANGKYYVTSGDTATATSITRSAGWHTLSISKDIAGTYGLYLDGTRIATHTFAGSNLSARVVLTSTRAASFYIDSLVSGWDLIDDFGDTLSWAASGDVFPANVSFGASSTQADTVSLYGLDMFIYSALGAWTSRNGTLSATSEHFGFSTLNDNVYFNSPHDPLMKFDGTSVTALAASLSPPRGGFIIEHKRRLWTAGDYADTSMLSYCDVDEPEDWIGGGDIRLAGKDSGGDCTGIVPFDNKVFYFSASRIWAVDPTGPDTNWTASMAGYNAISWSLGCVAPKSLVQTDNALIFLSADGVRGYGYIPGLYSQDGSGLIDLSENIRPTLDTISPAMRGSVAAAFYNGRYYLACALDGATANNAILVYSLPTQGKPGAWTKYVGTDENPLSVTCFAVTRGDEYGLYAGTSGGHIIRLDDGLSDGGGNIVMVYKTPQLAPKGFETIKHFSTLHLAGESSTTQTLDIAIDTDDVEVGTVSAEFGSGTAAQPVRLPISSRGRSIQYTLTGSGQAQPLTISRLTTKYLAQIVR